MELERVVLDCGITTEELAEQMYMLASIMTPNEIRKSLNLEPIKTEPLSISTNCKNCGAPIEHSKQNHNSICKCSYCGTEYIINVSNSK